jgi:hypothetical protein
VFVFCNGVSSWLKKSIRYQPIKGLSFICLQIIRGPFPAPATHEIAEDGEFFAADGEGFCHFTASLGKFAHQFRPLICQGSVADHNTKGPRRSAAILGD